MQISRCFTSAVTFPQLTGLGEKILKVTCRRQVLHLSKGALSADQSRSDLTPVISVFTVYGHMLYILCCQPEPPLFFCSTGYYSVYLGCELWSSPTVTNRWPLDLESSQTHYQSDLSSARPALIRARGLSPVFVQALKLSSGFVTRRVCSG